MKQSVLYMFLLITLTGCPSFYLLKYKEVNDNNHNINVTVEPFEIIDIEKGIYNIPLVIENSLYTKEMDALIIIKGDTILPKISKVIHGDIAWGDTVFLQLQNTNLKEFKRHSILILHNDSIIKEYESVYLNRYRRVTGNW